MNKEKLNKYQLTASIHTIEIETDGVITIPDEFVESGVVKPSSVKIRKRYDKSATDETTRLIINVHKVGMYDDIIQMLADVGCTYDYHNGVNATTNIYSYLDYCDVLNAILRVLGIETYTLTRADMRYDNFDLDWYANYEKLNRLLVSLIAEKYHTRNRYVTRDLFSEQTLSMAVRNKYMQLEIYDKAAQTADSWHPHGRDIAKGRMEERTRAWLEAYTKDDNVPNRRDTNSIEIVKDVYGIKWPEVWTEAIQGYQCVQDNYNRVLIDKWQKDQASEIPVYSKWTQFVAMHQECIYNHAQLYDLCEAITTGIHPNTAARNAKTRFHIEFFSMADLLTVIAERNRAVNLFFTGKIKEREQKRRAAEMAAHDADALTTAAKIAS